MNRRAFVLGGSSLFVGLSGCLGDDEDEEEESTVDANRPPLREVTVRDEHLLVEREALVIQDNAVFLSLAIKNTAQSRQTVEISLQIRDADANPVGTAYTRTAGPIEPQQTETIRIDLDEAPEEVGGYRLSLTAEEY